MGNEVYVKANLKNHLESIKPNGYILQSIENHFFYTKQENGKTTEVTLYYDEYFPHGVHFHRCSIRVAFTSVEEIYNDILLNHLDTGYAYLPGETFTFNKSFSYAIGNDNIEYISSIEVSDNSTFNLVKPFLQQMLTAALQFISQYQSLQDYYNYSESLPNEQLRLVYSQPLPPKRLIIKKLVNATDYNSYASTLINAYTNTYNQPALASFLQGLKTHLDTL